MHPYIGIFIAVTGFSFIIFIIIYAHKRKKKHRDKIFDNIKKRGYSRYDGATGKWERVER